MSGWDTVLQFDPLQKNLSIKTLMLTDLIIESAIRESGEKRSILEISKNSCNSPDLLFVHLFLTFNRLYI